MERFGKLKRQFYTIKLGRYPNKMEKAIRKLTFDEFNKEKEQEELEFEKFLKENQ